MPAAEAEPDGEDRRASGLGAARQRLRAVSAWTPGRRRLLDMRPVLELVVALRHAGGTPEVVDRDGRVTRSANRSASSS